MLLLTKTKAETQHHVGAIMDLRL